MESAVARICPEARVTSLMSDAPRHDARRGAYLLAALAKWVPQGGIIVAVVDPGVGSNRKMLVLRSRHRWFLGPDNGLLSRICGEDEHSELWELHPQDHWPVSASFHGRDVFAPAAAQLACGRSPRLSGLKKEEMVGFEWPAMALEVIYIDAFGNAMTGIPADLVSNAQAMEVQGNKLPRVRTFSDVPLGGLLSYENSLGLLEISINGGSAASALGLEVGSPVVLSPRPG